MHVAFERQRRFNRIEYDEQVNLDFTHTTNNQLGSYYENCRIKNISLYGIGVTGNFHFQPGDRCNVIFYHKTLTNKIRMLISGEAVWCNGYETGLKFYSMSHATYLSLMALLINNSPIPSSMINEFPDAPSFEIIY